VRLSSVSAGTSIRDQGTSREAAVGSTGRRGKHRRVHLQVDLPDLVALLNQLLAEAEPP
jgi:hypothetical protein